MKLNYLQGNQIGHIDSQKNIWVGEPKIHPVTVIEMTCGGGMGGSSWSECVERVEDGFEPNSLQQFTNIDGKKIILNTSFIVKIQNYQMVTVEEKDSHHNYYYSIDLLVEEGEEIEIIDDKKLHTIGYSDNIWRV